MLINRLAVFFKNLVTKRKAPRVARLRLLEGNQMKDSNTKSKKWRVSYGFTKLGILCLVCSMDEFKTKKEAKARIKELLNKEIVPPGERIQLKYVGSNQNISKGVSTYIRL